MNPLESRLHRLLAESPNDTLPSAEQIATLVRSADPLLTGAEVDQTVGRIVAHLHGLGPIEPLLRVPGVTDVMVNGPGPVWVERAGRLEQTDVVLDRGQIELLVERIVAPLGRRADPLHALVDGRLADGSRVHLAVPPVALDGPCITIRRFTVVPVALSAFGDETVVDLVVRAVQQRRNVVVSGATGSGKTTLLNALAGQIPTVERIITVEDAAELRLDAPHVVRLEARPADPGGVPGVSIRDLVRSALRMRPDRLIVGEVRGAEAFDLVSAMSTGHDGSLSTVHANSAVDALARLETLALLADVGLPHAAVRSQLRAAVDLVVHVARSGGGGRRVVEVVEVAQEPDAPRVLVRHGSLVDVARSTVAAAGQV